MTHTVGYLSSNRQGTAASRTVQPGQACDRPGAARPARMDQVESLTMMATHLHAMQDADHLDPWLQQQLREVQGRLDRLIEVLTRPTPLRTPPAAAAGPTEVTEVSPSPLTDLETRFLRWLRTPDHPDVAPPDAPAGVPRPLTELVAVLRTSVRPLPEGLAELHGRSSDTTIGEVAGELRWAVEGDDGPRCRSYRSAAYFLREHDRADDTSHDGPQS